MRVGGGGHAEQPGRTGEQVSAGTGVLVDGGLDGQKQLRSPLYFVDDQQLWGVDKADRVGDRRGSVLCPVEIAALGESIAGNHADQSALACLAGSTDQNGAGVSQSSVHLRCGAARDQARCRHRSW
jgi:hypothetical protein